MLHSYVIRLTPEANTEKFDLDRTMRREGLA